MRYRGAPAPVWPADRCSQAVQRRQGREGRQTPLSQNRRGTSLHLPAPTAVRAFGGAVPGRCCRRRPGATRTAFAERTGPRAGEQAGVAHSCGAFGRQRRSASRTTTSWMRAGSTTRVVASPGISPVRDRQSPCDRPVPTPAVNSSSTREFARSRTSAEAGSLPLRTEPTAGTCCSLWGCTDRP